MSWLRRLRGPSMSEADLLAAAREFLDRVETLGAEDPELALDLLRRRVRLFLPMVRSGRELYHRLREVVHGVCSSRPDRVAVVEMTSAADLSGVAQRIDRLGVEAVAVVDGEARAESDVVSEVEAETVLLGGAEVVVVVLVDGPSFCVRRTFLDQAAAAGAIDGGEPVCTLGRTLEQLATAQGLGVVRL